MHPSPSIVLEDLRKAFGEFTAVDGISLHVAPGGIYGLLGPNGAGKTTALRMLVGLLLPTGGHAHVTGIDVALDPAGAQAHLGFHTGSTGLYARLTAREVLAYFGRIHGMAEPALAARIEALAATMGMARLLDRRCENLSTGEKQRVSLARALLHDPPVLILDEPTSGLDVLARRFFHDVLRAERGRGKAILFSTHDLAEAAALCDRIGLLHGGRLLREGTPAALMAGAGCGTLEDAFLNAVADQWIP